MSALTRPRGVERGAAPRRPPGATQPATNATPRWQVQMGRKGALARSWAGW